MGKLMVKKNNQSKIAIMIMIIIINIIASNLIIKQNIRYPDLLARFDFQIRCKI